MTRTASEFQVPTLNAVRLLQSPNRQNQGPEEWDLNATTSTDEDAKSLAYECQESGDTSEPGRTPIPSQSVAVRDARCGPGRGRFCRHF